MATGIINSAYNGGAALNADQITEAKRWSTGKTGAEVASKAQELGVTQDQLGQAFNSTTQNAADTGYGTDSGLASTYNNFKYDGTQWNAPTPAAPSGGGGGGGLATAERWNVTPEQTASGQMRQYLDPNNPLNQAWRTQGKQLANERGALNSSMGDSMTTDSIIRNAIPIATSDASTYANSGQFNAGEKNKFGMQGNQNIYTQDQMKLGSKLTQDQMRLGQGFTQANLATKQGYDVTNQAAQIASNEKINANSTAAQITAAGISAASAASSAGLSASTQLAINTSNHQYDNMSNRTTASTAINGWRLNNISDIIKSDLSPAAKDTAIGQITTYADDAINLQGQWAGSSATLINSVFR